MTDLACTAVLIVRDEEAVIERCLRSVRDLVDDIVVLDTGSKDRTRELARDAGARVIASTWRGDFAAARNEAASHARGQWILSIDADERVTGGDRQRLLPLLSTTGPIAYRVSLRLGTLFTPYRACRLFRNDPRIRFEGRIRESVLPSIRRIAGAAPESPLPETLVADCDLHMEHEDDPAVRDRKHARDLHVLDQAVREDGENVLYWTDFGRALAGTGDVEGAMHAWQRAMDLVRRIGGQRLTDSLPYADAAQQLAPEDAGRRALLDEASMRFPENRQLMWLRAETLVAARQFAEAEPLLRELVAADNADDGAEGHAACASLAYDRRIFAEFAYGALATCCFGRGQWAEAADWYARAEAAQPSSLEYRAKRALALKRQSAQAPARG